MIPWKSYFFPRTVYLGSTSYNKNIRVVCSFGRYKLLVEGSPQSGDYIRSLWSGALRHLKVRQLRNVRSALVLGVAGGTVIELIALEYPEATITGVEIDKKMLELGRQYFGLDAVRHLDLIVSDCRDFLEQKSTSKGKYDLIIVDLFFGRYIPGFETRYSFLQKLKSQLTQGGDILINYLREKEYGTKADEYRKTLQKIFRHMEYYDIANNRFFLVR